MKTLFWLAVLALGGFWLYRRSHPAATPAQAAQAADNAATRYAASLQRDEVKAGQAVSKMNAGIQATEKAASEAAQQ